MTVNEFAEKYYLHDSSIEKIEFDADIAAKIFDELDSEIRYGEINADVITAKNFPRSQRAAGFFYCALRILAVE